LLSLLAQRSRPTRIIELVNSEHWMPTVSHTFHGRDILAPVAAQLSLGLEPERLGPATAELMMLDWPEPRVSGNRIEGAVRWIDGFGNLMTNIPARMLPQRSEVVSASAAGATIRGLSQTYGERKPGDLIALVGSSGYLELAVVDGSAAAALKIGVNAPVTIDW
jgi:S-adenosylmethionine hydrolase